MSKLLISEDAATVLLSELADSGGDYNALRAELAAGQVTVTHKFLALLREMAAFAGVDQAAWQALYRQAALHTLLD